MKWDGYRLAIHIEPSGVRILTRGGHDWTDRFPAIAAQARRLPVATAILDGEAVVFDERGRSDFGRLQQSLGGRGGKRTSREAVLMAFDLLYFDGRDLTGTELSARRHLLEEVNPIPTLWPGAAWAADLASDILLKRSSGSGTIGSGF